MGYAVALNKPYAGGYITEHYGRPQLGRHALQVEVNRALYMDETSFEKSAGFERLKRDLEQMVGGAGRLRGHAQNAEGCRRIADQAD